MALKLIQIKNSSYYIALNLRNEIKNTRYAINVRINKIVMIGKIHEISF